MDLVQNAPYVLAAAGVTLIVLVTVARAHGILNGLLFKALPAAVGAVCLWTSALMLAGA